MPLTIIDTDILIDEGRGVVDAADFLNRQVSVSVLAISAVTQMELTIGCRNKAEQRELSRVLKRFQVLSITSDISDQAVVLLQQ